jgi:hypothetical protein
MLRRVILAGLSTCFLVGAACLGQSTNAQAQTTASFAPGQIATGSCWIDAQTGAAVLTGPPGWDPNGAQTYGGRGSNPDPNHVELGGHTFVKQADGSWIDAAGGNPVRTGPPGWDPNGAQTYGGRGSNPDPNHVELGGHTFVRVPCPPPSTASSTVSGLYLGGELVKNWGRVRSTETLAATGAVTNQFTDTADPFGGGLIVGYKFTPWANAVVVSPFASFDFLHAPVNHTFPGGSYLGTTANFMGTGGVKIGPQLDMGLWLYGIAGVSVLNETLNVNFIPIASSQSAWVAGGTLGVGGAWQPSFLQGFGRPVSLFLEYQHTWWQSANFNTPAASTLSNYNFARQDDVVKFGFTVSLSAPPPPPPTRGLITK